MFGDAHVPGVSEVGRRERTRDELALELEAEDDVEAVRDRIGVDPDQRALDPVRGPVQRLRLDSSEQIGEPTAERAAAADEVLPEQALRLVQRARGAVCKQRALESRADTSLVEPVPELVQRGVEGAEVAFLV